jgi:cyclic pyranopterin phosphate synthase
MLQDEFGRRFYYLRLSVTDVCNFKCNYCLPDGYQKPSKHACASPLTLFEIQQIAQAFAHLGTQKIRITGGEPSIRNDLPQIIETCKSTTGIRSVGITTNGYKLPQYIKSWIDAGLDRINVSIDSLDPRMFHTITGHNRLDEVLKGLFKAAELGLPSIKINAVLMQQYNVTEFSNYLNWIKDKPFTLRFIELMQTVDNVEFFKNNHVAGESIRQQLIEQGWTRVIRSQTAGPAQEFQHPDYLGRIGLIMPYSQDFCKTCNRLRVSSQGKLHLCLFGEEGLPMREFCGINKVDVLKQKIIEYVAQKKVSHFLHQGNSGSTRHLAMLGG